MVTEEKEHIVRFDKWCSSCKHCAKTESQDPCWECLDTPTNTATDCPVKYEEAKRSKK